MLLASTISQGRTLSRNGDDSAMNVHIQLNHFHNHLSAWYLTPEVSSLRDTEAKYSGATSAAAAPAAAAAAVAAAIAAVAAVFSL